MTDYAYHLNYWYKLNYVTDDYFLKAKQHFRERFDVRNFISTTRVHYEN
jgi:hypothetical protein